MGRRYVGICTLCWSLLHITHVQAQSPTTYTLSGYLRNRTDSTIIAYAHSRVSNSKTKFAVSDTTGFFALQVNTGDTVLFSAIGFTHRSLLIRQPPPRTPITIWMNARTHTLEVVRVFARSPMQSFFSYKRIDYSAHAPSVFIPTVTVGFKKPAADNIGGIVIDGLLTSLLLPFTSEYKQMKRLHAIRRKQQLAHYYNNLLNERLATDNLRKHLPQKDTERKAFLAYWKPKMLLLEVANDYTLLQALKEAKKQYIEHLVRTHSHRSYLDRITTFELREQLNPQLNKK